MAFGKIIGTENGEKLWKKALKLLEGEIVQKDTKNVLGVILMGWWSEERGSK
ncbi:MAG: hypothetical protein Q8N99_02370 [Nanoarchaeota archaeon]|nr:hypothetical protein [Nanoarchaeota archaeon]